VSVVDTNNCTASDDAYLYVVPPLTGFNWDTTIVIGDSAYLPIDNIGGTVLFTWTPSDGLSCLQCSNPSVRPLADMTYSLYAEDFLGCTSATYEFDIHIRPETFIELPTTFTPNGDGVNDIIYVKGWGIKELESFRIYNRWGEMVFESTDLEIGWDGYYKGILQNNDVYVYKVRATSWSDKEMSKEGHINLMR
jgi:gliding motility-associated-like protein